MKRPARWLAIQYHTRAIYRALLALWYSALSDVEDWWKGFVKRHVVAEAKPFRVAVYPHRGPASQGQVVEWRVYLAEDVPISEGVDQYLYFLEKYSMIGRHSQ